MPCDGTLTTEEPASDIESAAVAMWALSSLERLSPRGGGTAVARECEAPGADGGGARPDTPTPKGAALVGLKGVGLGAKLAVEGAVMAP